MQFDQVNENRLLLVLFEPVEGRLLCTYALRHSAAEGCVGGSNLVQHRRLLHGPSEGQVVDFRSKSHDLQSPCPNILLNPLVLGVGSTHQVNEASFILVLETGDALLLVVPLSLDDLLLAVLEDHSV